MTYLVCIPVWSGTSVAAVWGSSLAVIKEGVMTGANALAGTAAKALAGLLVSAG